MNQERKTRIEQLIIRIGKLAPEWQTITDGIKAVLDEEKAEFEALPEDTSDEVCIAASNRVDEIEDAFDYCDGTIGLVMGYLSEAIKGEDDGKAA